MSRIVMLIFSIFLCFEAMAGGSNERLNQFGENNPPILEVNSLNKWGKKNLKICGHEFQVPFLSYAACYGAISTLPASCSIGAATSAGLSCGLSLSLATFSCGISYSLLQKIAADCMKGN